MNHYSLLVMLGYRPVKMDLLSQNFFKVTPTSHTLHKTYPQPASPGSRPHTSLASFIPYVALSSASFMALLTSSTCCSVLPIVLLVICMVPSTSANLFTPIVPMAARGSVTCVVRLFPNSSHQPQKKNQAPSPDSPHNCYSIMILKALIYLWTLSIIPSASCFKSPHTQ